MKLSIAMGRNYKIVLIVALFSNDYLNVVIDVIELSWHEWHPASVCAKFVYHESEYINFSICCLIEKIEDIKTNLKWCSANKNGLKSMWVDWLIERILIKAELFLYCIAFWQRNFSIETDLHQIFSNSQRNLMSWYLEIDILWYFIFYFFFQNK